MRHKYLFAVGVALIWATPSFCQILNNLPSRVLGHPNPEQISNVVSFTPNLVEGRELYQPEGIALDASVTPPIVYVSDTGNNRVLAWKNATSFSNGAFADLVIGQNNAFSTIQQGPGASNSTLVTGFTLPSGLAVYKGDLYVVDGGNNRILRFPKPFSQTSAPPVPDLVIGQPNLTGHSANYAATLSTPINEQGIYTAAGTYQAGLAFDASGNLWFTDTGNARVLRFPAANIPAPNVGSTTGGIRADLAIGQPSLTSTFTNSLAAQTNPMLIKNQFGAVTALGFDPAGRLYVVDGYGDNTTSLGRVLVFATPSSLPSGDGSADRVMGVVPAGELTTLGLTGTAATALLLQTWVWQPGGVFFLADGSVGIVDTLNNRIMVFPPYSQWDSESAHYSPLAASAAGQGGSFLVVAPNNAQTTTIANGTPPASGSTFYQPVAAAFLPATNELFVADSGNNRVVAMPLAGGVFKSATRVLGQDRTNTNSANLIEGREFQFTLGRTADAGIALDTTGTTPHLYVSDPYNHRVLGYYDARLVTAGKKADLVIGQPDFQTALCNYNPAASNGIGGDTGLPTQSSLCGPIGLAVDKAGNLYVADSDNGRVLRFPAPFAAYPKVATLEAADLVLGQAGFTAQIRQAGNATMVYPYGVAFSGTNGLVVSDASLNRVLYFPFTSNGTFTALADNGKAATKVFGQADFFSKAAGTGAGNFNVPMHVSSDGEGRVYVADVGQRPGLDLPGSEQPLYAQRHPGRLDHHGTELAARRLDQPQYRRNLDRQHQQRQLCAILVLLLALRRRAAQPHRARRVQHAGAGYGSERRPLCGRRVQPRGHLLPRPADSERGQLHDGPNPRAGSHRLPVRVRQQLRLGRGGLRQPDRHQQPEPRAHRFGGRSGELQRHAWRPCSTCRRRRSTSTCLRTRRSAGTPMSRWSRNPPDRCWRPGWPP